MGSGRWGAGACLALVTGCGGADPGAEEPSPVEIELVGPDVISTELPEFAATLTPDGDTLWFNRTSPDRSRLELFMAVRGDDGWLEARPFGPTAGETAIDPFLGPDGTLYFSSDRPRPGGPAGEFDLWYLPRTADEWGAPVAFPAPVNSDSSEVFNTMASDGTMVFSSWREGERRIYETRRTADGWTGPTALWFGDTPTASNPAIAPDGRWMVVAASPDGEGPPDLYVTCREAPGWSALRRLPEPVNSPFADFAPGITASHLWFTSERPGIAGAVADSVRPPGDIYRVRLNVAAGLCEREP